MSPTVTTPTPPAAPNLPAEPPATPGPLRNGNPRGNPNLAPRCGAKARTTGTPCCAPAMANGRCRLHGGKCTGPRTPEGKAAFKATHTRHGRTTALKRAANLYARTLAVRSRLTREAHRLSAHLPPDMAARLVRGPQELWPPVHLTNHPYVTNPESAWHSAKSVPAARSRTAPKRSATSTPHGLAAERLAARAEKAAMAPWRQAIAAARATKRAARAAKREAKREAKAARRQARAARTAALPTQPAPRAPAADHQTRTTPPVPTVPDTGVSLLQRELAARAAGLRTQANRPPQGTPTPAPTAPFKPSRIDPMNREPAAKCATAPFEQFRIDPMNREPAAKPGPTAQFKQSRIDPMNREPTPKPSTAPFKPSRIDPMNREPAPKPSSTAPFKQSRIDPMNREHPAAPPLASLTPTNDQAPPAPLNRAARRRLKYLQHRRACVARPRS